MGSFIGIRMEHTLFQGLVTDYLRRKATPGSNNKQAEINSAAYGGVLEGLRVGLAELANQERIALMRNLNLVIQEGDRQIACPSVSGYDVANWTRDIKQRWDAGEWKDVEDEQFFDQIWLHFMAAIVWEDTFTKVYKAYRKDAVLAGRIEPSEADLEWLKAEHENFKALASPYEQALSKLYPSSTDVRRMAREQAAAGTDKE